MPRIVLITFIMYINLFNAHEYPIGKIHHTHFQKAKWNTEKWDIKAGYHILRLGAQLHTSLPRGASILFPWSLKMSWFTDPSQSPLFSSSFSIQGISSYLSNLSLHHPSYLFPLNLASFDSVAHNRILSDIPIKSQSQGLEPRWLWG